MADELRVAISSGHHNSDSGNPVEAAITGELTEAYARAFKSAGWDVRVITPDGPDADAEPGDGMFPGGLQAAARKVVEFARAGWLPDLYLETHTEGVADPNVRGVFAIFPNMSGDLDKVVRDILGGRVVRAIAAASGLSVRGSGLMAESETGVGRGGDRLGIFKATEPVAPTTNRMIIEHGSHSSPADLAILRTPGMFDKIATAAVKAFNEFYGVNPVVKNLPYGVTVDSAGALIFPINGVKIPLNFGFKEAFLTLFGNAEQGSDLGAAIIRAVRIYGLPVAPEVVVENGAEQEFEFCWFGFNRTEAPGWQVRLKKKSTFQAA